MSAPAPFVRQGRTHFEDCSCADEHQTPGTRIRVRVRYTDIAGESTYDEITMRDERQG